MTAVDITDRLAPSRLGQATAVEQSRAVAEVQAAIVVAQQCPRDIPRAVADMQRSCAQKSLAERAFFRYSRGGSQITGPSVQLARELARCFGNVQYGIAELRRDDVFGQSEMIAFAWDVQTNTRSSTTFIVPHRRDKSGGPVALTDMRDIYENNANNGARRLREMIFAILPGWFTEDGKSACYETITAAEGGEPLAERVQRAIEGFAGRNVTAAQLEQKLGAPCSRWTAHDLAQLSVIYRSIQRGEVRVEDEFPAAAARVTAEEITGQKAAEPRAPKLASDTALGRMNDLIGKLDLGPQEDIAALIRSITGGTSAPLTVAQVRDVISLLNDALTAAGGDLDKARAQIWEQYHRANPQAGDDGA